MERNRGLTTTEDRDYRVLDNCLYAPGSSDFHPAAKELSKLVAHFLQMLSFLFFIARCVMFVYCR